MGEECRQRMQALTVPGYYEAVTLLPLTQMVLPVDLVPARDQVEDMRACSWIRSLFPCLPPMHLALIDPGEIG